MTTLHPIARPLIGAALLLAATLPARAAGDIVLDDFTSPAAPVSVNSPTQDFVVSTPGTYAGVANQFRAAYYWQYYPDTQQAPNLATIGGSASVVAAAGTIGEYGLGYGAYGPDLGSGQVNGAFLNQDLSAYNDLKVSFSHLDKPINLVVGFYTSNPVPGSGPLYYWDGELNLSPAPGGGAITADFRFKDLDKYPGSTTADQFNFAQVDGIVFIIDRAAIADGNSYSLTKLSFTQAVPEPASAALMLAGVASLVAWRRRRS